MKHNFITLTDSYKVSHHLLYPPKLEFMYSYLESRGSKTNGLEKTVFFGLQYFLNEYFAGQVITQEDIDEAYDLFHAHFGNPDVFNRVGWQYILDQHGGRLPLDIRAVKEGTVMPMSHPLMTIENTDPLCGWLTNYVETLLVELWYAITVASQSREMKRIILRYAGLTGEMSNDVSFNLHDFGFRGVSSLETASIGGAAHMINFMGTDTFAGLNLLRKHYGCKMAGHSIPAYEHSTVTSWGRHGESACLANGLSAFPNGMLAIVADSYDIFSFCSKVLPEHKETIKNRKGTVVIRPDSGEPAEIIVRVLDMLAAVFGFTYTATGYKLLPPYIRAIIGDGIRFATVEPILQAIMKAGYSTLNVAFGSGGGLLQQVDRDTMSFAFKCSNAVIDGRSMPVYKDPVTGKSKRSKHGRLCLTKSGNNYFKTKENCEGNEDSILEPVFLDGKVLRKHDFDEIRSRATLTNWSDW